MKQTRLILTIAILLTFGLVSIASAQMMGKKKDNPSADKADSTSQLGKMNMGMMHKMDTTMGNMSQNCKMMSSDIEKLQIHFEQMMQISDKDALKVEMKKHQKMMKNMHTNMMQQQSMCQNMMSMMHSNRMNDKMDKHDKGSDSTDQNPHKH